MNVVRYYRTGAIFKWWFYCGDEMNVVRYYRTGAIFKWWFYCGDEMNAVRYPTCTSTAWIRQEGVAILSELPEVKAVIALGTAEIVSGVGALHHTRLPLALHTAQLVHRTHTFNTNRNHR